MDLRTRVPLLSWATCVLVVFRKECQQLLRIPFPQPHNNSPSPPPPNLNMAVGSTLPKTAIPTRNRIQVLRKASTRTSHLHLIDHQPLRKTPWLLHICNNHRWGNLKDMGNNLSNSLNSHSRLPRTWNSRSCCIRCDFSSSSNSKI